MSTLLRNHLRLLAIVAISFLGFSFGAQADDNLLSVDDMTILPGETTSIPVSLSNSSPCYGLQFDISLPKGLTLKGVEKSTRTANCMLTPNLNAGKERVVLLSLSSPLEGNEGEICRLTVEASSSFRGGSVKLSNIRMSDGGTSDVLLSATSASILTVKSVSLDLQDFSITAGESKNVNVGINADGYVAGVQFDLYLPSSLTADLSSFALSDKVSGFILDKQQHTNFIRVLIASFSADSFSGVIDNLASFTVKAADDASGTALVELRNIAASSQSGVSIPVDNVQATVTIDKPIVSAISMSPGNVLLKVGERQQFAATVSPDNVADKTVVWSIDNTSVATVDENGLVSAVGLGTATLTATSKENPDVSATAQVTVTATSAASITLNHSTATLKATETIDLVATILPETTTDKSVTWSSSDEAIATVDANGKVTAVAVGKATIKATAASGVAASCEVTVVETPASDIVIDKDALGITGDDLEMRVGDVKSIKVTVLPETTTDKSVTFTSSNPGVASVDSEGNVSALSLGTATVTITAASGVSAQINVTVVSTPAASITLNHSTATLKATETIDLVATILPETTTDKSVTWSSSDEAIATVDATGKVTAMAVGKATIKATVASGVAASCEVTVIPTDAASITLNHSTATLKATETIDLVATILPETTTDKSVTWSSSDEAIATVDANGKVTAMAVGKATIKASAASGVTASCEVTVIPTPAASISLNHTSATLKATETIDLVATILPETTTDKSVTWSSSDEAIATVDANGKVTAVAVGKATIKATAASGVAASCEVTVIPTPAASITLNHSTATLKATETIDLVATILPETTTDKSVTWSSSDEAIATVDANGKVIAVAVGKATIKATAASGVAASCEVTVVETPASDIVIDKDALGITGDDLEMRVGDVKSIKVTVLPETTTDKSVTFTSSNPGVASVDSEGNVSALSLGTTTVTITAASGVSAQINVTVVSTPAASITLNHSTATLKATETIDLVATILPETTTDKSVTWSSSDEAIATVDANGKVIAVAVGKATIKVTAASGVAASCEVTVIPTDAASITLNHSTATLKATETIDLVATILPETTTDKSVTWSSSDEAIATVDANGKVTAVAVGKATIKATAASGVAASCEVTVIPTDAASITLNHSTATLKATETIDLVATILPETTTDKSVTWSSSDEAIATVDANGKVTAVAVGKATIKATAASGVTASCEVTVIPTDAASITLNHSTATLKATETIDLVATILPETTTDKSVTWSSSDEAIATVDANGKVIAVAVGKATIKATATSGVAASCEVTVIPTDAASISLNHTSATLKATETIDLVATILPETTTDKSVTWSSSDEAIATVDVNGKVTAVAVGKATIKATAASGVAASCEVTVIPTDAASITLNHSTATLKATETIDLVATILPETTTDKSVTWSSYDEAIATVDANGKVTAILSGTATITATAASGISAICVVTVIPRDTDPITVTRSESPVIVRDGDPVEMWVSVSGGNTAGWSFNWSLDGTVVSSTDSYSTTAVNTTDRVKTDTYLLRVVNVCDGAVIFDESYTFDVEIWPGAKLPGSVDVSTLKIREGNLLTLSVEAPQGGYDDDWSYRWECAGTDIGNTREIEVTATMADGTARETETKVYGVTLINEGPDGNIWTEENMMSAQVEVYRRPQMPRKLMRKGDGTTHTFVTLSPVDDAELAREGYRFVYGYTTPQDDDRELAVTSNRYCRAPEEIYRDPSLRFWVYAEWTFDDGSVVTSGKRYLDGSVDEAFDGSVFDGSAKGLRPDYSRRSNWVGYDNGTVTISIDLDRDAVVSVFAPSGQLIKLMEMEAGSSLRERFDATTLPRGVYVVTVRTAADCYVNKFVIR